MASSYSWECQCGVRKQGSGEWSRVAVPVTSLARGAIGCLPNFRSYLEAFVNEANMHKWVICVQVEVSPHVGVLNLLKAVRGKDRPASKKEEFCRRQPWT